MLVQIEVDKNKIEPEIIIRCSSIDKQIEDIQKMILNTRLDSPKIIFYKDTHEYYFPLDEVLFFETENNAVYAHSREDVYKVKFKLYELEKLLPKQFTRVSKSTILNITHIFSIDRTFATLNLVQFYKSHKQVYVSRFYYKSLKHKLDERRTL